MPNDYINRADVHASISELPHEYRTSEQRARTGGIAAAAQIVRNFPASDVKPVVRGKWIKKEPYEVWKCSVCEVDNMYAYSYGDDDYELQDFYCPHCGAKMEDGNE